MSREQTRELLTCVRELLSDEKRWTKRAGARTATTAPTRSTDSAAICWCLTGAIGRCAYGVRPNGYLPAADLIERNVAASRALAAAIKPRRARPWTRRIRGRHHRLQRLDQDDARDGARGAGQGHRGREDMSEQTSLELMDCVGDLLSDPERWTKGTLAADVTGMTVDPKDPRACRWCLVGAMMKCDPRYDPENSQNGYKVDDDAWSALEVVAFYRGAAGPIGVNDSTATTHAGLMSFLADARSRLEKPS